MKMIKLAMALMVVFALVLPVQVFGQNCVDNTGDGVIDFEDYPAEAPEGGGCGNYDDCNGNGAYDASEPCHEGNGGQTQGQQEGQHEGPQAGDECDQCDHVYVSEEDHHGHCRECQAVMDDQSDWDTHCQANPEHCRPQEGDECHECDYVFTGDEGESHGHCDQCDHVYDGEEDHHGHCRECQAVMDDQSDWDTHCEANPEHCRPQEGDECHECEYVYTGDEGEDHGHCEVCKAEMNSPSDWDDHCRNNEGHCPDGGDDGGGGEGPAPFDAVDTSHDDCINLDEAFAFFGQDEDRDEFANGNDEDPGFNDFANEDEDDTSCGNDQVNRKEFFKGTYRSMNQRNDDNLGQATMANCAAWCAGIPNYKTKDQSGEWSGSMARYDDADCPCHPDHDNDGGN